MGYQKITNIRPLIPTVFKQHPTTGPKCRLPIGGKLTKRMQTINAGC
jgi:hypothetical protein